MDSTSHKCVRKVSSINILSVDIAYNACFTDFVNQPPTHFHEPPIHGLIDDSHESPIHGLKDGLNFHVMLLEFKCYVILLLSRSLTNTLNSYSLPIKLLPLSYAMIFTSSLLVTYRLRANVNDSVVRLSATSRCNALIVKQTKITSF